MRHSLFVCCSGLFKPQTLRRCCPDFWNIHNKRIKLTVAKLLLACDAFEVENRRHANAELLQGLFQLVQSRTSVKGDRHSDIRFGIGEQPHFPDYRHPPELWFFRSEAPPSYAGVLVGARQAHWSPSAAVS